MVVQKKVARSADEKVFEAGVGAVQELFNHDRVHSNGRDGGGDELKQLLALLVAALNVLQLLQHIDAVDQHAVCRRVEVQRAISANAQHNVAILL